MVFYQNLFLCITSLGFSAFSTKINRLKLKFIIFFGSNISINFCLKILDAILLPNIYPILWLYTRYRIRLLENKDFLWFCHYSTFTPTFDIYCKFCIFRQMKILCQTHAASRNVLSPLIFTCLPASKKICQMALIPVSSNDQKAKASQNVNKIYFWKSIGYLVFKQENLISNFRMVSKKKINNYAHNVWFSTQLRQLSNKISCVYQLKKIECIVGHFSCSRNPTHLCL